MNKKKVLLVSSILLFGATISTVGAVTLAGFSSAKNIEQTIYADGRLEFLIYLNPGLWDSDSPTYVLHCWKDGGDGSYNDITGTKIAANNYYVFKFNDVAYDRFVIYRNNTNNTATWNQTDNITFDSSYNLYTITGWDDSPNSNSGYTSSNYNPS